MEDLRNNIDAQECCEPCNEQCLTPVNPNCSSQGCDPIQQDCDITDAVCVPILSHKIFDCICLEDEQFKYDPHVKFYIEDGCYKCGDPICIENVCVDYDFIGLNDRVLHGKIDAQNVNFYATPDSAFKCTVKEDKNDSCEDECESSCNDNCNDSNNDEKREREAVYLYDEYIGTISDNGSCHDDPTKQGVKSRIFEESLKFYVCNLRITVTGMIGCVPFKASTRPYSGPLSQIPWSNQPCWTPGFKTVDFYGRICVPKGAKKVSIYEEFKGCLNVDCVSTSDTYKLPKHCNSQHGGQYDNYSYRPSFCAAVEYSFLANKTVYSVIKDKLSVFTTPEGVVCHSGMIVGSGCTSACARSYNKKSNNK